MLNAGKPFPFHFYVLLVAVVYTQLSTCHGAWNKMQAAQRSSQFEIVSKIPFQRQFAATSPGDVQQRVQPGIGHMSGQWKILDQLIESAVVKVDTAAAGVETIKREG